MKPAGQDYAPTLADFHKDIKAHIWRLPKADPLHVLFLAIQHLRCTGEHDPAAQRQEAYLRKKLFKGYARRYLLPLGTDVDWLTVRQVAAIHGTFQFTKDDVIAFPINTDPSPLP